MVLLEKTSHLQDTLLRFCSKHNEPAFKQRCARISLGVINLKYTRENTLKNKSSSFFSLETNIIVSEHHSFQRLSNFQM